MIITIGVENGEDNTGSFPAVTIGNFHKLFLRNVSIAISIKLFKVARQ